MRQRVQPYVLHLVSLARTLTLFGDSLFGGPSHSSAAWGGTRIALDKRTESHLHSGVVAGRFLRVSAPCLLAILASLAWGPGSSSAADGGQRVGPPADVRAAANVSRNPGTKALSPVARRALEQGYLTRDGRTPGTVTRRSASGVSDPRTARDSSNFAAKAPTNSKSLVGIRDTTVGPSDSTGAIGTTRFMELVNSKFRIIDRNSATNTILGQGSLNALAGRPSTDFVFDPQTLWDPTTNRFYYLMDDVVSDSQNMLAFGWSKTASPSTAADFCHYVFNYGAEFPDYPKLGDSGPFIFAGVNTFEPINSDYLGSDLAWIAKPAAGTTCPAASTVRSGAILNLAAPRLVWTPVGVNQIDNSSTGYVLAVPGAIGNHRSATNLIAFPVTKDASGNAVVGAAKSVSTVSAYEFPDPAPEPGVLDADPPNHLDTLDGRLTQAVSAVDPAHGGATAIWTQHTVWDNGSGQGSKVRWYEINPAGAGALLQQGQLFDANLASFNAAISPDRARNGSTVAGGNAMVLNYNASSATVKPQVRLVSKIGASVQSAPVLVKSSPSTLDDFTCDATGFCRWGDYAGASPDPIPPTGTTRVWGVSQFVATAGSATASGWGSWIFATQP
jgi:hypothetical protein